MSWSGSLAWGEDTEPPGPDDRLVDADEIAWLEPNLRMPPPRAVYRPGDGAVDPVAATEALVDAARRHGAEIRLGEEIRRLRVRDGAVIGVETASGFVACRTVVLAAGVGAVPLCAALGVELPVAASPARLAALQRPARARPRGGLVAGARRPPDRRRHGAGRAWPPTLRRRGSTTASPARRRCGSSTIGSGCGRCRLDGVPIIGPLPGHPGALPRGDALRGQAGSGGRAADPRRASLAS